MTTRNTVRSFLAFALVGLVSLGCGTATPPAPALAPAIAAASAPAPAVAEPTQPVFVDVTRARPAMVGSVVTAAPAKIVEDLDMLSKRLDLPMRFGRELLSSLSGLGLFGDKAQFAAFWGRLDPSAPFAVVWVFPARSELKGYCVAITFRDAAGAQKSLDGLGAAGERAKGLVQRRLPDGEDIWAGIKGRTMFISGSPDALLLGGGLAEQAQAAPPPGQVAVTVLPPALIAASGKTRDALLTEAAAGMAREIGSMPGFASPAAQRLASAFASAAAKVALDATSVNITFEAGPSEGIVAKAEVVPAAGSSLASLVAPRSPLVFDAKLPIRDDRTAVTAIGDMKGWLAALAGILAATGPAGQSLRTEMDTYFAMMGEWSCALDVGQAELEGLCSARLKEGTKPKAALDAVVALTKAAQAWEAELYGKKLSPLKIKRKRDVLEIEKKFEQPDMQARAMAKALVGGETIKSAFKVKDGHLLVASGRDARKALERYGKGGDRKGAPLLANALSRSAGAEAMMAVDVVSMALQIAKKAKDVPGAREAGAAAAMPGLEEMKAPFLYTLRTGSTLSADFRIPLGSLESIAKVVRGLFGAVGAPR